MASSKKILVVDDEVHIRRVVELKLRKGGYEVITASNGEEGLRLIESERPDAVVTDINMPRLDGKQLCERSDPLKAERPFLTVVTTCRISPDERRWVNGLRDTEFMEKPFSPSKLLESIDTYFGTRR